MKICEFCDELNGVPTNRFRQIYRDSIASRIVARTANFVAMPTIGQLFKGSLLIIPKRHVETCANLELSEQFELQEFISSLGRRIAPFGFPMFFEHGAISTSGGSCGIYHAHVHLVPLPSEIGPRLFFDNAFKSNSELIDAYRSLKGCENYLLMGDAEETVFAPAAEFSSMPPSQYFRKRLCEHFQLSRKWNWREACFPENDLIETVRRFQAADVT